MEEKLISTSIKRWKKYVWTLSLQGKSRYFRGGEWRPDGGKGTVPRTRGGQWGLLLLRSFLDYYLRQQQFDFHVEFNISARLSKHPVISFPRIFNNFDVCIRSIAERSDFLEDINRHFFRIQSTNKCDKKFCKICKFAEWKKRQLSYVSFDPKPTSFITYHL